jgi:adenine deaminase
VYKDRIVFVGNSNFAQEVEAEEVVDLNGKYLLPGFIDSHTHIESTLLHPAEFSKIAIGHGTCAVISDPHEIANVLGKDGINYILDVTKDLPVDFYFLLPSCVPSTNLGTSGAKLTAEDIKPFLKKERILGLAEVMNYPGVVQGTKEVMDKLETCEKYFIDGHAPSVTGKELCGYISCGIRQEHEATTLKEAKEKLRLGMRVKIREGSSAKNLSDLIPLVNPKNSRFFSFCTDDIHPEDLQKGHLNLILQKAVHQGLDPVLAVQMATINPALHYDLQDRGAIAPGYQSDILVVTDLLDFKVNKVYKKGKLVAEKGKCLEKISPKKKSIVRETIHVKDFARKKLILKPRGKKINVIEIVPGQITTNKIVEEVKIGNDEVISDIEKDILKLVVVERHKDKGNIGIGFVKGFGIQRGAIASSVSHDSHNIISVGASDEDIFLAVKRVMKLKGGMVVISGGLILAELPLPIAGLMTDEDVDSVVLKTKALSSEVQKLGCRIEHPFFVLSFLALPVIPSLKLTDLGLVDVDQFKIIDLFLEKKNEEKKKSKA